MTPKRYYSLSDKDLEIYCDPDIDDNYIVISPKLKMAQIRRVLYDTANSLKNNENKFQT